MSWKTLDKSGLEPTSPNRLADRKHCALNNLNKQKHFPLDAKRCAHMVWIARSLDQPKPPAPPTYRYTY